ncbi:MAG: hypothetical protein PHN39_03795, partial [Candidatus Pacebacteria bacterium]|nr:hypothetical protein [Candidatus Paceibacterota bacterium]
MLKDRLRKHYDQLSPSTKKTIKWVYGLLAFIPFTGAYSKRRWMSGVYRKFSQDQRRFIFLSIARFCNINRPIGGYYFEFGSFGGNTMKIAWDTFRWLFDFTYVAFDSFKGLPDIKEIDKQAIWEKG